MVDLGTLGGSNSGALGVSADGSVVVGYSNYDGNNNVGHAFRWTTATGMKDLNTLLANAGVNMTGITLASATAVSGNGQFIIGQGDFPGAPTELTSCAISIRGRCRPRLRQPHPRPPLHPRPSPASPA
jgi:probable HAF family extracellular repeat protein